jgi:hypothetical protein
MSLKQVDSRDAMIAFWLAKYAKENLVHSYPTATASDIQAEIDKERSRLETIKDLATEQYLEWKKRVDQYTQASNWEFGEVDLSRCRVWPVEERPWCKGTVNKAVAELQRSGMQHRVQKMAKYPEILRLFPIIVFRLNDDPTFFCIDDGTHRSCARYIAGDRIVMAYIATVPRHLNHTH